VPPFLKVGEMAGVLAGAQQVVGLDTGFTSPGRGAGPADPGHLLRPRARAWPASPAPGPVAQHRRQGPGAVSAEVRGDGAGGADSIRAALSRRGGCGQRAWRQAGTCRSPSPVALFDASSCGRVAVPGQAARALPEVVLGLEAAGCAAVSLQSGRAAWATAGLQGLLGRRRPGRRRARQQRCRGRQIRPLLQVMGQALGSAGLRCSGSSSLQGLQQFHRRQLRQRTCKHLFGRRPSGPHRVRRSRVVCCHQHEGRWPVLAAGVSQAARACAGRPCAEQALAQPAATAGWTCGAARRARASAASAAAPSPAVSAASASSHS
jgi:hypothetical protein